MGNFNNPDGATTITGTAEGDTVNIDYGDGYYSRGVEDSDTISTGGGNDIIYLSPGTDTIDGGDGFDRIEAPLWLPLATAPKEDNFTVSVELHNWIVDIEAGTYTVEFRRYDSFFDEWTIYGTGSGTFQGIEEFWGSTGSDIYYGTSGNDVFRVDKGANSFDGRDGFDRLYSFGYQVKDLIRDHVEVNAKLGNWLGRDGEVSTFTNIEEFRLSDGGDIFIGSDADETVVPYLGADKLNGGGGTDVLNWEQSSGSVVANIGNKTATITDNFGGSSVVTFSNFERFVGTVQDDKLTGSKGGEYIAGSYGDDMIFGKGGRDELTGGLGDDEIRGGSGKDQLQGGSGADRLFGDAGDDRLDGGFDVDRLTGGDGADTFVISADGSRGADIITDFTFGTDVLVLV